MIRMEAVYGCGDSMTPDVAAKLTAITEYYDARLEMDHAGKRVLLDSLIGILSVPCNRGDRVTIRAEGGEAPGGAGAIAAVLEGKRG